MIKSSSPPLFHSYYICSSMCWFLYPSMSPCLSSFISVPPPQGVAHLSMVSVCLSCCPCHPSLHSLCELGVTVIATIHQPRPEIFDQLHSLLLLTTGGRLAYCGPAFLAQKYFSRLGYECPVHDNPADFIMDVLAGPSTIQHLVFVNVFDIFFPHHVFVAIIFEM